jgi:hypothetical protein
MKQLETITIAVYAGIIAVVIGLIAFILNWTLYEVWDGPIPGYQVLLFPGNVTLVYVWHPLFTEEIDLFPKLGLILFGQFIIVTSIVYPFI